jgi:hypothetical protein
MNELDATFFRARQPSRTTIIAENTVLGGLIEIVAPPRHPAA